MLSFYLFINENKENKENKFDFKLFFEYNGFTNVLRDFFLEKEREKLKQRLREEIF